MRFVGLVLIIFICLYKKKDVIIIFRSIRVFMNDWVDAAFSYDLYIRKEP